MLRYFWAVGLSAWANESGTSVVATYVTLLFGTRYVSVSIVMCPILPGSRLCDSVSALCTPSTTSLCSCRMMLVVYGCRSQPSMSTEPQASFARTAFAVHVSTLQISPPDSPFDTGQVSCPASILACLVRGLTRSWVLCTYSVFANELQL